jgi:alpha-mannosidase
MLKHPALTLGRVRTFLRSTLAADASGERHPLAIEISERDHADQRAAEQGKWKPAEKGRRWGPAYATAWFRLRGTVPEHLAGRRLAVVADVGGERTVWRDNSPWCGVDVEHSDFGWLDGHALSDHTAVARAGEAIEYYVQAYARNTETTVHGREQPRQATTETVGEAALVAVRPEVRQLIYDVEFALSLLETIEPAEPAYAVLLRALNDVTNTYRSDSEESLARSRKLLREATAALGGELRHTITPVGHAHLDTAWLWPLAITRKKMAHTTATQLALLDRYPEYIFVHSQASQYEWLEIEYPELFQRVKSKVAEGRWEPVGSMWVEADCNLSGGEALVRQFLYGRRYFREKLGYQTDDMWLPDVFGYSAALPQILAKFNIKYFLTQKISWNQFNKFPHHTFWWKGIDGTRVWTHFPPADTYNASAEPKEVIYSVRNYKDHGRSDQSLYVFGFGDGGGGPTERHLELLRRGRSAAHYPEVAQRRRAKDFFREAKMRSRDLLTWSGELYLELHRGTYTSQAAMKRQNRETEFLLRDAEWLACFDPEYPRSYPQAELEAAWKKVLLNQFHDIIPGSSVREVYEDADRDYAEVRAAGKAIIERTLQSLGARMETSAYRRPVVLFHNAVVVSQGALPWEEEFTPASLVIDDEAVPVQLVEEFGERKLIFPVPSAALGAAGLGDLSDTPAPQRRRLKSSPRRIENDELIVRFDPNGNITGIQAEGGIEFVEPGKLANLFQVFEDKPNFWSAWDIDAFALETGTDLVRSESFEIVERGPVRVAAEVVKRIGNSILRQRISLGPTPGIRFDTEVDWHEEDRLLKVAFPVNVNANRATYEIQFGNVERPTHRNTSWDMAKFEVCAQKWMDLSEGNLGMALLNDGKYGHDCVDNVMRLTLLRSPKAPDPLCDMGQHRFTYVLLPHFGPFHQEGVVSAAYALNAPVRTAFLTPHAGEAGQLPPFLFCDDRNVVIETVKKAEEGSDVVIRLYECHNTRGRAELHCLRTPRSAVLCDLEEQPIDELEVNDGIVSVEYKPFEIITIRLRL